jgi:hypothetical protein
VNLLAVANPKDLLQSLIERAAGKTDKIQNRNFIMISS